jgi:hypothetical protein
MVKVHRIMVVMAILTSGTTACGISETSARPHDHVAPTISTTAPTSPTATSTKAFVKNEVAYLGATLTLTALLQRTPPIESPDVRVTLDRVIDPASEATLGLPKLHDRWVELEFTLSNAGHVTVPVMQ